MRDSWSQRAEADGVLGFGADDRVTECLGGHDDVLSATACAMAWLTLSADSSVLKFTGRATF